MYWRPHFFAGRWHLAWPYSTIFDASLWYGAQLIYIWLAMMIYFLLFSLATRTISLHRLAGSLGKSALVFVAVSIVTLALFVILPEHAGRAIYRTRVTAMQMMSESLFLWMRLPFFCHAIFVDLDDAFAYRQETHKSGPGLETQHIVFPQRLFGSSLICEQESARANYRFTCRTALPLAPELWLPPLRDFLVVRWFRAR
jgi:hypothetical protein